MKSLMTFLAVLMVFAAIAAVFYGGYLAVEYIWRLYAGIDASLRLIVLSSFAVFLLGCFVLASAIRSDGRANKKGNLQEARLDLYKSLVEIYKPCLAAGEHLSHEQISATFNKLEDLQVDVQIIAADAVIESHEKLSTALANGVDQMHLQNLFQQLIKSIRQDLGHGAGYDEARLKFLLHTFQDKQSDLTGDKVQV